MKRSIRVSAALTVAVAAALAGCRFGPVPADREYDVVIAGGRVMDPESGLDAVRDIGLLGDRIAALSSRPLRGRRTIDARGLVVAPGFVDLHSHGQDPANYAMKAADGVTVALELEIGVGDIPRFYAERAGKALVHHGASVGHVPVRMAVMGDPSVFLPRADGPAALRPASVEQIADIRRRIGQGLAAGAVAVGFGIQYTPAASRWEILEAFREAAAAGASCHVHMRHNGTVDPNSSTTAVGEVIAASAITGAPLHIVHLHSTSVGNTTRHLQMLHEARSRGLDVTTEVYPYTYGMTDISSGVFNDGWREALGSDYKDLQWVATGRRLDAESFARYRKQGGLVAVHSIPPAAITAALAQPFVMVASDGIMAGSKGHPRSAGCYTRFLGRYVREQKVMPLLEGLRRITLLPAQRLERLVPMMRAKGRLRVGADADLVAFDAVRVIDRATFDAPTLAPEGMVHVLVSGVPVVAQGQVVAGVFPGRGVRAPVRP